MPELLQGCVITDFNLLPFIKWNVKPRPFLAPLTPVSSEHMLQTKHQGLAYQVGHTCRPSVQEQRQEDGEL